MLKEEIPMSYYISVVQLSKKKRKKGRSSGGLWILIRTTVQKFISACERDGCSIWLKFDKSFFKLKRDFYLFGIYIPNENSQFRQKK